MYTDKQVFFLLPEFEIHAENFHDIKTYYLFNSDTGDIYELNDTSYYFISLLNGKTTIRDIIENSFKKYLIDKNILRNDLCTLLHEMNIQRIIKEGTQ